MLVSSRTQDITPNVQFHHQTSITFEDDHNEEALNIDAGSSPTRSNLERHISDFIHQKEAIQRSKAISTANSSRLPAPRAQNQKTTITRSPSDSDIDEVDVRDDTGDLEPSKLMTDSERHSNHDDKDDGTRSEILTDEAREVANQAGTVENSNRSKKSKIV